MYPGDQPQYRGLDKIRPREREEGEIEKQGRFWQSKFISCHCLSSLKSWAVSLQASVIGYKFDSLSGDTKSTNVSLLRYPDNKQDYTGLKWNDGSKPAKSYRQQGIRVKLGTSASMWKLTVISFFRKNPRFIMSSSQTSPACRAEGEGVGGWAVNRQTREGHTSCFAWPRQQLFLFSLCILLNCQRGCHDGILSAVPSDKSRDMTWERSQRRGRLLEEENRYGLYVCAHVSAWLN